MDCLCPRSEARVAPGDVPEWGPGLPGGLGLVRFHVAIDHRPMVLVRSAETEPPERCVLEEGELAVERHHVLLGPDQREDAECLLFFLFPNTATAAVFTLASARSRHRLQRAVVQMQYLGGPEEPVPHDQRCITQTGEVPRDGTDPAEENGCPGLKLTRQYPTRARSGLT